MKLAVLLFVHSFALFAQTVTFEGNVRNARTGAPIAAAHLVISAWGASQQVGQDAAYRQVATVSSDTDDARHFEALPLPVAIFYELMGEKKRFRKNDSFYDAIPGDHSRRITVSLVSDGMSISGKVEDQAGSPVEGAVVEALRYEFVRGRRTLRLNATGIAAGFGGYSISNLRVGRYYLRAVPVGQFAQANAKYQPEFYGGTVEPADECAVELDAGLDRDGINFRLVEREGVNVSARVVTTGQSALPTMTPVELSSLDHPYLPPRIVMPDPVNGNLLFRNVWPGAWKLSMSTGRRPLQPGDVFAQQTLQVGRTDPSGVVLEPKIAGMQDVSGSVVFEGGAQRRVVIVRLIRGQGTENEAAWLSDDGSFVVKDLLPGHYRVAVEATADDQRAQIDVGFMRSTLLGSKEVGLDGFDLDGTPAGPLRITLTSATGSIDGKLLSKEGQPVAGQPVMVVGSWCQLRAISDAGGSFRFDHLFPGLYHVFPLSKEAYREVLEGGYVPPEAANYPPLQIVEGRYPVVIALN